MRRILVTSALPYANGAIHLGHLVEYIQTDIWARYQRLRGHDCLYLCADDTHGTPIMLRAKREGVTPEQLIERMSQEHRRDFDRFAIQFDHYYSTHSPENRQLAEQIYLKHRAAGHIRTAVIQQAYCPHDQMFLPDRFIRGCCPVCQAADQYGDSCEACSATYTPLELTDARCAVCGTAPVARDSEHLFFKLDDFRPFLQQWTRGGHIQDEVANKLEEWFSSGLKDWNISRDAPYFGFAIPDAPGKFFYVWLDAPIGYMATTLSYCQQQGRCFDDYWLNNDADRPTEVYHFIGKDILYFHALFWPAVLHGAGFRTPNAIFAHGFLTVNGQKMSKSRGTFIDARHYPDTLNPEYLRYYYATKLTSRIDDIDLNLDDFIARVNSDLVGKLVNLASRTAGFIHKQGGGRLAAVYPDDGGLYQAFVAAGDEIGALYEGREFARAMQAIMRLAERANQYVEAQSPWKLAKQPGQELLVQQSCTVALNLFRLLATYLQPALPLTAARVAALFNLPALSWDARETPLFDQPIQPFSHLMARIERATIDAMLLAAAAPPPPSPPPTPSVVVPAAPELLPEIPYDLFAQVDLRIARIEQATLVAGADKLLCLTLDLGAQGQRTVLAGIRAAYPNPEILVGRLTVMVANLQPRQMKFGRSEGMVLAAGTAGSDLYLLAADSGAQPGMRVK
ncbi:MAG: methionine--tRNA ligase [Magnetococcales bacterium]|nr:methionine--tRNA ligase [Magnetococcales bacterium]